MLLMIDTEDLQTLIDRIDEHVADDINLQTRGIRPSNARIDSLVGCLLDVQRGLINLAS